MKLLKDNFHVILDEHETYDSVSDTILQTMSIRNYKRYIDNIFIERNIDRNMKKICKKVVNHNDNEVVRKDDNINIFGSKICFYSPCLTYIYQGNYCSNHNKDMI